MKLRLGLLPLNNSAFSSLFSRDTPDGCDYCGEFEDEKHFISASAHCMKTLELSISVAC